jgi:hypothetical protein
MPFSRCTLPQAWFVGVGRAQLSEYPPNELLSRSSIAMGSIFGKFHELHLPISTLRLGVSNEQETTIAS